MLSKDVDHSNILTSTAMISGLVSDLVGMNFPSVAGL